MLLKFGCTGNGFVWYGNAGTGNVFMLSSSESLYALSVASREMCGSLNAAEQHSNRLTHLVFAIITVTMLANAVPSMSSIIQYYHIYARNTKIPLLSTIQMECFALGFIMWCWWSAHNLATTSLNLAQNLCTSSGVLPSPLSDNNWQSVLHSSMCSFAFVSIVILLHR